MLWLSTQLPTQTISHPARALHQVQPLPAPAHIAGQGPTPTLQMQVPATHAG